MKRPSLTTVLTSAAGAAALSVPFLAFADDTFVSLTSLPGINSLIGSPSLPSFVNNLYRLCIGAAALFAFVEIVWAGYLFMSNSDNISKNTKARQKIMNAIIGLVLVLSPYIVFSIINPKILDLSLDFTKLKSGNGTGPDVQYGYLDNNVQANTLWTDSSSPRTDAKTRCDTAGGTTYFVCTPKEGGTGRAVSGSEACDTSKETGTTVCRASSESISGTAGKCSDYSSIAVASDSGICNGSGGYQQIANSCCAGASTGSTCCGKPK